MSSIIANARVSWPNSSGVRGGSRRSGASGAPSSRPPCEIDATACVSWRSGRVTVAMIHTVSSVASTTTPTMATSAGLAMLLPSTCSRPSGSTGLWHTRYR